MFNYVQYWADTFRKSSRIPHARFGTLAYYLLIANRGRSDDQILEGNGASAKQIKLKSWQRSSTILTLMLGGFFFVRIVEHPSSEASWFAFEIICCLGFIIRDLENRAFKIMD